MTKRRKTTMIINAQRPPKEKIVAELWYGDILLGEVSKDGDQLGLEIYSPKEEAWKVDLEEFIALLSDAKHELRKL